MKRSILALALALGFIAVGQAQDAGFVILSPDRIVWHDVARYPGVQVAVLAGDPARQGLYILRAKFPPGVMTRPHRHSRDRYVTVLSGTWYAGTGSRFDPDQATPLPPGSFMKHPAGAAHFDGARDEEVIVEIRGLGPVTTEPAGE